MHGGDAVLPVLRGGGIDGEPGRSDGIHRRGDQPDHWVEAAVVDLADDEPPLAVAGARQPQTDVGQVLPSRPARPPADLVERDAVDDKRCRLSVPTG